MKRVVRQLHRFTEYVASVDQSTTGTKFSIFTTEGKLMGRHTINHTQICPKEGWLQHDPMEILHNTNNAMKIVISQLKEKSDFSVEKLLGLGITNQRQTIVCWDEEGNPMHNAIVWSDNRCRNICTQFSFLNGDFKKKVGLPVSPYFSAFKIQWLLRNVEGLQGLCNHNKVRFGTIDSWLAFKLTNNFVTDATNASRTHLCDLTGDWNSNLLKIFGINEECLPTVFDNFFNFGTVSRGPLKGVKLRCMMGDQQSSAFAQGLSSKDIKITYGTGCFLLSDVGKEPRIHPNFLTTVLRREKGKTTYGYEASVECGGGTLNWAQRMGWFQDFNELNSILPYDGDVVFFPSFGEILSPFWRTTHHSGVLNLGLNVGKKELMASLLQSIGFRLMDNLKDEAFASIETVFVDGGMTENERFMQLQADLFNKKVQVRVLDTSWGVAKGVLHSLNRPPSFPLPQGKVYHPNPIAVEKYAQRYARWSEIRTKIQGWK